MQNMVPPPLAREFETILRSANSLDPDLQNWRFDGLHVAGVTPGAWDSGDHFWRPDRERLIYLARRTAELRAERWDGQQVRQPVEEWSAVLQQHFKLNVTASVGSGWRDLLWAALELSNAPPKQVVDIKSKFGSIRIYHLPDHWGLLAETLSSRICECCGAPGEVKVDGVGWYRARCDAHADKSPWREF